MIVFDIETGPLPGDILRQRIDSFQPPAAPGDFDASQVKIGNLKDELKIREKIAKAKEDHEAAVAKHAATVEAAKTEWWQNAVSQAPLSPLTGQVLAIGYLSTDADKVGLDIAEEPAMLERFWLQYRKCRRETRQLCGHNIYGFDVPFVVRRSWLLDVMVPDGVLKDGRWLDTTTFVDTMSLWGVGQRQPVKLDSLAKAFGVGGKPYGVDGSMFWQLLGTDREAAEAYLRNDLDMTAKIAQRMGVI